MAYSNIFFLLHTKMQIAVSDFAAIERFDEDLVRRRNAARDEVEEIGCHVRLRFRFEGAQAVACFAIALSCVPPFVSGGLMRPAERKARRTAEEAAMTPWFA